MSERKPRKIANVKPAKWVIHSAVGVSSALTFASKLEFPKLPPSLGD